MLTPPTAGVVSVMRRPSPVHRIDRGTSGLLICAKTKPAMAELCKMFKERRVKKTCELCDNICSDDYVIVCSAHIVCLVESPLVP